jgi:hypothetical protein
VPSTTVPPLIWISISAMCRSLLDGWDFCDRVDLLRHAMRRVSP